VSLALVHGRTAAAPTTTARRQTAATSLDRRTALYNSGEPISGGALPLRPPSGPKSSWPNVDNGHRPPYHQILNPILQGIQPPLEPNGRLSRLYRCHLCGVVVPPNTPAHRKVVETRRREYPFRKDAHLFIKEGRPKKTDDPGGVGFEIVREVVVCPSCFEERTALISERCGPLVLAVAA